MNNSTGECAHLRDGTAAARSLQRGRHTLYPRPHRRVCYLTVTVGSFPSGRYKKPLDIPAFPTGRLRGHPARPLPAASCPAGTNPRPVPRGQHAARRPPGAPGGSPAAGPARADLSPRRTGSRRSRRDSGAPSLWFPPGPDVQCGPPGSADLGSRTLPWTRESQRRAQTSRSDPSCSYVRPGL